MKKSLLHPASLLLAGSLILAVPSPAQMVIGQYEDEAPFRTWNSFALTTASSLGRGSTSFALASDCSAALSNPSLLIFLPKLSVTLNGSFNQATFFKYSLVNTGVLSTEGNFSLGFYALDFGGVSFRAGEWAFALVAALTESYDRPDANYEYYYRGALNYSLGFFQKGLLNNINFALARRFGIFSLGLGLNYIKGDYEKELTEKWPGTEITITSRLTQNFDGFFINGGLTARLSDKFTVAAVFRTPFTKRAEAESGHRYLSLRGKTDILIKAASENSARQPLVIGAGAAYRLSANFLVSGDIAFHNWSRYRLDYFEERITRDFRDIIRVSAGAEYFQAFKLFNREFILPLRLGVGIDPQPMKLPKSSYAFFSIGTGLYLNRVLLDFAFSPARENGSGNSLSGRRAAFSLTYRI